MRDPKLSCALCEAPAARVDVPRTPSLSPTCCDEITGTRTAEGGFVRAVPGNCSAFSEFPSVCRDFGHFGK
jgi:hypothetical protein